MAYISALDESLIITGAYAIISLPDESTATGFKSYRIKLEDFISGGGGMFIDGTNSDIDYLDFDLTPATATNAAGRLWYNTDEKTLSFGLEDGGSFELGKTVEDYYTVSGFTPAEGDIVSIITGTGNQNFVELTDPTDQTSAYACIGMITAITGGTHVRVTKIGKVHELNTDAYNEGTVIYVDPSNPGKWTTTRPASPNYTIIAGVVSVKSATVGVISINLRIIPKLEDLSNVDYSLLTTSGLVPVWNNVTKIWEPTAISGGDPATAIHAATTKDAINDNDEFGFCDSESSYVLKKTTWSNIKSKITTYLQGISLAFTNPVSFVSSYLRVLGSSTGYTSIASANTSATNYTATLPAKDITIAGLDDISGLNNYDATIGTGGTYPVLNDALAAGKTNLKAVGNVSVSSNITLTVKLVINLNAFTLDFGSYNLINSGGSLFIYDDKKGAIISFIYGTAKSLFANFLTNDLVINKITFANGSTVDSCPVGYQGNYNLCTFNIGNKHSNCLGTSPTSFTGIITDCVINGGGTSCYNVIYNSGASNVVIRNLTLLGSYSTSQTILFVLYELATLDRILYSSATVGKMSISNGRSIIDINSKLTVDLVTGYLVDSHVSVLNMRSNTKASKNVIYSNCSILQAGSVSGIVCTENKFNGTFTYNASTGVNNTIDRNTIAGVSSITGTYLKFLSNICTGAVTLNSGTGESDFCFNTFTAGITDNSGLLTNNILYNH